MSTNTIKVNILLENQEIFKKIIGVDAKYWETIPYEDGGYFICTKNNLNKEIICAKEPIDVGDKFGDYVVNDLNYKPINGLVYLELELV